jgi:hypothetical protein
MGEFLRRKGRVKFADKIIHTVLNARCTLAVPNLNQIKRMFEKPIAVAHRDGRPLAGRLELVEEDPSEATGSVLLLP